MLLPFLEPLVPGMAERLSSATRLTFADLLIWAVCVGDPNPNPKPNRKPRLSPSPNPSPSPSPDPNQVCVGDLPMAECFWHQCQRRGDPVRMALIAAQVP